MVVVWDKYYFLSRLYIIWSKQRAKLYRKHWNSLINMSQAELQVFNDSCWIPSSWKSQLSAASSFNLLLPPICLILFLVSLIASFLLEASFLPRHISFSLSVVPSTVLLLLIKKGLGRKSLNKQIENTARKFVI